MSRLEVVLVVVGGFLALFGYREYQVGAGASRDPVPVAIGDLEAGVEPPDKHLEIGEHWAIFPSWVGWGEEDSDQLDYIYYPIVSESHPYNQAWDALLAKYGDREIPEDEYPQLTSLSVLVKSRRYKRVGAVPPSWAKVDSVTGLLVNDIAKLKTDEERLLQETYPALSLANILILEEDRKPRSAATASAIMIGGVVLVFGGVGTVGRNLLG